MRRHRTLKRRYGHTRPPIIGGKWYVVDRFQGMDPIGPFDTEREAEKERNQINIGDDCVSVQAKKRGA